MNAIIQVLVVIAALGGSLTIDDSVKPNEAVQAAREAYALLNSDAAAAARKAREARELLDENASSAVKSEFDLLLALAEFRDSPKGRRAGTLERTLTERDENGFKDTGLSAQAWLDLAGYAYRESEWKDLARFGARADKAVVAVAPNNYDIRSVAVGFEGIGKLHLALKDMRGKQTGTRIGGLGKYDVSGLEAAVETFERGIALFPIQPNMESFNRNLANLIAWRHAAMAVFKSWDLRQARAFEAAEGRVKIPWPPQEVPGGCEVEWAERPDPDYPDTARMFGYAGAAIIVYDINQDGEVRNSRILAEVPTEIFGPAILKAMKHWRAKIPEDKSLLCFKDRVQIYEFFFN